MVLADVQRAFSVERSAVPINGSIGFGGFPDQGNSADDPRQTADTAMYRAKSAGGCKARCALGSLVSSLNREQEASTDED
jgi:GGDEF domain-containing protein